MSTLTNTATAALGARNLPLDHGYYLADSASREDLLNILSEKFPAKEVEDELHAIKDLSKHKIEIVSIFDSRYPSLLAQIYSPPLVLYLQGARSLLSHPGCLAIVGSRNADLKGCQFAYDFSNRLSAQGACIVSGLALGVDGAAHRGAIDYNKHNTTIAVLGNGLPDIYPSSHQNLASKILSNGGLLVSPFPPGTKALRHHFLYRNQIIAGLSHGGLIVQAGHRSGSLSTARHLLENGREVFVLPGDIDNPRYRGSLSLIKTGASLVQSAEDIVEHLPNLFSSPAPNEDLQTLTTSQKLLVDHLMKFGNTSLPELENKLNSTELLVDLLELETQGLIKVAPGSLVMLSDTCVKYTKTVDNLKH